MRNTMFIILLVATFAVQAKESESQLIGKLPSQIMESEKGVYFGYEDKKLGGSVGYRYDRGKGKIRFTVILFDAGYEQIKAGLGSSVVSELSKSAVEDIKWHEQHGSYKNVQILNNAPVDLLDQHQGMLVQLKFRYVFQNESVSDELDSFLLVTGVQGYILKIRATGKADNFDTEYMLTFTKKILAALNGDR